MTLQAEPDHLPRLEDLHFDDVFQVLFYCGWGGVGVGGAII